VRHRRTLFALAFFLLSLSPAARAQDRLLTIDDIFDPQKRVDFSGTPPSPRWLKDGTHYLVANPPTRPGARLQRVNARTGESAPFFDSARMEAALAALPGMSAADAKRLSNLASYQMNPAQTAFLINHANDLFLYQFDTGRASRLTNDPAEEVGETFSPDGKLVAFVRGNNIHVLDLATGQTRALTKDGSPKILNGRLDWVYQEELYGRGNFEAYWWSPDSQSLAYLRFDETPVHEFAVVDHIPVRQALEMTPYPKAGDPNPLVKLGVVNVAGGETRWIDTESKYKPEDLLIVRVGWTPDSKRVMYQAQNREQTWLDLNLADARDGKTATLFKETSKAWVEVIDPPTWLKDGTFVWQSERDGWRHLYHYAADGKLIRQITKGDWEVRSLEGVDEKSGRVFFTATERSHIAPAVYSVRLDGTNLRRLTEAEGTHSAVFDPTFSLFVNRWSDVNTPAQVRLFDADGRVVRVIDENRRDILGQFKLGRAEFMQVKTRDGFTMEAVMIRPPDFDPAKKYPVITFTYGGPHAPQVRNAWGGQTYLWHQLLAQKGYIIWVCDNRTASGKGTQSSWQVYKNFGELELRDIEDGLAWLRQQPYVDGSRIGIWGWSYGGFMTSYALTHSKSFKIGIAGGSVTDWRDYDTIYTERYMQTPQNNPEGYRRSSPVHAAKDLHGKILLLHGLMDDNVHVQNTIQFAYELQKAGKQFELMLYPKQRHGITDPLLLKHMRQLMTDFILQNL
jgi:dipeptidyl-peptidase-4